MTEIEQSGESARPTRRPNAVQKAGTAILAAVDKAIDTRWEPARERAAATHGTLDERVDQVAKQFARELGMLGAAAGGVSAVPGVQFGGAMAAASAEFGLYTFRTADLIMTVAAIHGHTAATMAERRAWVLSVLAFGEGASEGFMRIAREAGIGLGKKATKKIPTQALRAINTALNRTVITKYGKKRGAVAIGNVLPFGFGAAIGGGANYLLTRAVARSADRA